MLQAKQVATRDPLPEATGGVEPVVVMGEYITTSAFVLNAVVEMVGIPADTVPVDYVVVAQDCDSNGTPLITIDVGLLSGLYGKNDDARTIGAEFLSASQLLRAGGVAQNTLATGLLLAPSNVDRGIGLKVTAAAATLVVGAKIRMYVTCMPKIAALT